MFTISRSLASRRSQPREERKEPSFPKTYVQGFLQASSQIRGYPKTSTTDAMFARWLVKISTATNGMALATWRNKTLYRMPKMKLERVGGGKTANSKRLESTKHYSPMHITRLVNAADAFCNGRRKMVLRSTQDLNDVCNLNAKRASLAGPVC